MAQVGKAVRKGFTEQHRIWPAGQTFERRQNQQANVKGARI